MQGEDDMMLEDLALLLHPDASDSRSKTATNLILLQALWDSDTKGALFFFDEISRAHER